MYGKPIASECVVGSREEPNFEFHFARNAFPGYGLVTDGSPKPPGIFSRHFNPRRVVREKKSKTDENSNDVILFWTRLKRPSVRTWTNTLLNDAYKYTRGTRETKSLDSRVDYAFTFLAKVFDLHDVTVKLKTGRGHSGPYHPARASGRPTEPPGKSLCTPPIRPRTQPILLLSLRLLSCRQCVCENTPWIFRTSVLSCVLYGVLLLLPTPHRVPVMPAVGLRFRVSVRQTERRRWRRRPQLHETTTFPSRRRSLRFPTDDTESGKQEENNNNNNKQHYNDMEKTRIRARRTRP